MDSKQLYLQLVKDCLIDNIYPHPADRTRSAYDKEYGRYWPTQAMTMAGQHRMNNVEYCVETTIRENIPGDFIECGVWRGGLTILMRAVLAALGVSDRLVWVADSFDGCPPKDLEKWPKDESRVDFSNMRELAISLAEVRENFRRFRLLDNQVKFLPGFFEETMPDNPVGPLAVLRLDGDMYSSTYVCLEHLYPKLSVGGFCILDDVGALRQATDAMNDYRQRHNIETEITWIESRATDQRWGVYWRKE